MSRIIVKNLPKNISSSRLENIFSSKGKVTDVQLKFTDSGTFRQFAFVGFQNEDQAEAAKKFFHDTYVDSSKIKVETCETLGSVKPWSKHSKHKIDDEAIEPEPTKKKKHHKKSKEVDHVLDNLKADPKFEEFLSLHEKGKTSWSNDRIPVTMNRGSSGEDSNESEEEEEEKEEDEIKLEPKLPALPPENKAIVNPQKKVQFDGSCTVKLKDLPFHCKKKQIKAFFAPLKITSLRIPPRIKGIAFVKFKTDQDMKKALIKHRGFMEGHRVSVLKHVSNPGNSYKENTLSSLQDSQADPLTETGRIFVRNLFYSTTVEDIENHFKTFGPVTEVHLPLDQFTKKIKGFAFVTFMFPEHAVKAFSALDGSSFQGRTLHLLPAKAKKIQEEEVSEDASFKKKKESKQKATSGSWHNWNTLFLGANAVADVMAQKYNTSKAKLMDSESKSSIAVTMALGETQIVSETKDFLTSQGVHLDAFINPQTERSKTVMLVKNLPANTKKMQIRDVFSAHGEVTRIVLPPSGVTAIVEFKHQTEAKLAFRKTAYSKFQHVPLYLEWAPVDALGTAPVREESVPEEEVKAQPDKSDKTVKDDPSNSENIKEIDEEAEESGTILFVKNLNFVTREDALQKHFEKCGKIASVTVAKKKDHKNPGEQLSMGYGFVQFKKKKSANKAIKELQRSSLDGHCLEIKLSTRDTNANSASKSQRKITKSSEQKSTKILIRNIPFEASTKEIKEIFSVFGELRALRLPKKVTGEHRGFGFVDYLTRHDAKRAMTSLGASTHVFGRRLVLEWAAADEEDDVDALRRKTSRRYQTSIQHGAGHKKLKDSLPQDPGDLSN